MKKRDAQEPEAFLRRREPLCAGACGRFLNPGPEKNQVWLLRTPEGSLSALLLFSRRTLLPVFGGQTNLPLSRLVRRHFRSRRIHAVQGLREEALALEAALAEAGLETVDTIDYDLMTLDGEPAAANFRAGPPGLILRRPDAVDTDALFELQAGYEKEETLPRGSTFNAAACRLNLQQILGENQILAAELDGRLVGKINVSLNSFTRCQIGGVYVHPAYRGLGIARRMTAEFIRPLAAQGRGITLFVKKNNPAARSVYLRTGFRPLAGYRISYYPP
jgi:ribosomal protein S18 acetylase RimI-like enzyme